MSNDAHTARVLTTGFGKHTLRYHIFHSFADLTQLHREWRGLRNLPPRGHARPGLPGRRTVFVSHVVRPSPRADTCLELSRLPGDSSWPLPLVMLLLSKSFWPETNTAALAVFEVT